MIAILSNVPNNRAELDIFSFNLREEVRRCNQAILQQRGVDLPDFQLYPVPVQEHITDWLSNVSQAIGSICSVLNITSQDIFNVDLRDQNARIGWTYTIWQEISAAEAALQI